MPGKALTIEAGQKVQSVPDNGQQPQTFESICAGGGRCAVQPAAAFSGADGLCSARAVGPGDRGAGPFAGTGARGELCARAIAFCCSPMASTIAQEEKKIQSLVLAGRSGDAAMDRADPVGRVHGHEVQAHVPDFRPQPSGDLYRSVPARRECAGPGTVADREPVGGRFQLGAEQHASRWTARSRICRLGRSCWWPIRRLLV